MLDYKIEFDENKWLVCLAFFGPEGMAKLKKVMLSRIGESIRGEIVKHKLRGQVLGRVTGDLAANMYWYTAENDDGVDIGNRLVYARIHELGGEIRPINGEYLHFKIGENWIKTKLVKMPARPYIGPTIQEWVDSGKITAIVEKVLDKKLESLGAK